MKGLGKMEDIVRQQQIEKVTKTAMDYLAAQWEDPRLRAEFGNDFKRFVAFKKAEAGGRAKIYGRSEGKKAEAPGLKIENGAVNSRARAIAAELHRQRVERDLANRCFSIL